MKIPRNQKKAHITIWDGVPLVEYVDSKNIPSSFVIHDVHDIINLTKELISAGYVKDN